jgi:hypothetical protein
MSEEKLLHPLPSGGSTGQPQFRVFLKQKAEIPSQPPSWLARRMGLHLYSNALLTKKVRTEMNFAAGLLLLVSLFEWLLWTLLFNGIYSSDIYHLGGTTMLAALTALFFGFAVFWFERQMLTSSEKGWKPRVAMACRFVYICIAALITSQTFELMLFHKPIQQRARQEATRANAAKHYQEVFEADERAHRAGSLVQLTTDAEKTALAAAKSDRQKEENHLTWWNLQLAQAQTEENPLKINQYSRLLLESRSRLDALGEKERLAEEALKNGDHHVEAERDKIIKYAATQRQRLHAWAVQLRDAEATGKSFDDGNKWKFEDPKPLFFEQLFLLADLMEGRPAGWPGANPKVREALRNEFGFYEPPACPDSKAGSQLASTAGSLQAVELRDIALDCERRRSSTRIFFWSWLAGLGTAMLIPMLILIIKIFLLPEELRFYYSRPYQAELGDIEALHIDQATERLRNAGKAGRERS